VGSGVDISVPKFSHVSFLELKKLVALYPAVEDDDGIWIEGSFARFRSPLQISSVIQTFFSSPTEMKSLQNSILKLLQNNRILEKDLQEMEAKIALLIQNRKAIQKVSRPITMIEFKKKHESPDGEEPKIDLERDEKMMDFASNLFHLIQTNPRILFRMYASPPKLESPALRDSERLLTSTFLRSGFVSSNQQQLVRSGRISFPPCSEDPSTRERNSGSSS
jgi:hypothetical protein